MMWYEGLRSTRTVGDHYPMTSTADFTVHLVVRRHVDFGKTRSMMCLAA
jgi:hypothetical protein